MGAQADRLFLRGEVCIVTNDEDRDHGPYCGWWKDPRSKACSCGKIQWSVHKNIVTTAGLLHYAELWERGYTGTASPAPTVVFDAMSVATAISSPPSATSVYNELTIPSGGEQPIDTNYPLQNDPDTDNPGTVGPAVLTWRITLDPGEGTGTLTHLAIHNASAAGAAPLLSVGALTGGAQVKAASQSAKCYANHALTAV